MLAKVQLADEYPDNPYFATAMAEVYLGLTDEEALRLAQRHNLNSHFVHKLTHHDLVSFFLTIHTAFPVMPRSRDLPFFSVG